MFKVWLKAREITFAFTRWFPEVEKTTFTNEWFEKECRWALEQKVREEVLKYVETEIDREICRKIAADFIKDFDYKPILEKAMLEKFEGYVRGAVAPPMVFDSRGSIVPYNKY